MTAGERRPARSWAARIALGLAGLILTIGFAWLGTWQVERRAWKLALIARVERRLPAAPVAAPGPAGWPGVTRARDEYRRVRVTGRFLPGRRALVAASTRFGPGYWLMTPLRDARGFTVLVNRGFVPTAAADAAAAGPASVTGLLRLTEPGGDLLRRNDPRADRWYSRDVAAIAATRRLGPVAPYFIDAGAEGDPNAYPRGGLTVVAFPNNHLVYALTWYTLMAMAAAATIRVIRAPRDGRRRWWARWDSNP